MPAAYGHGDEQRLIELYLRAQSDRRAPISLAHGVRAIRTLLKETSFTEADLAQMIALAAARDGRIVAFDRSEAIRESA